MAVEERDAHTGYKTTGHEWNGIKELNAPVPKPVYFFLTLAVLVSIVYWVLMPAWPTGRSYTKGLLGEDQRATVERQVAQATAARAAWAQRLLQTPVERALSDAEIMARVHDVAPTLFGDNCAVCHGADARGAPGYPNLRDDVWIWGGAPEEISETLRVGVNAPHADTRVSQMLAFGRDKLLSYDDVRAAAAYVHSFSNPRTRVSRAVLTRGREVFAGNCTVCHGETGQGVRAVGGPDLTDDEWLYGGDEETIFASVWGGRHGVMPAWQARLSEVDRRLLTLYLLDLQEQRH
jgi:cytochrome c oxidase, cbb3-type, subunit III